MESGNGTKAAAVFVQTNEADANRVVVFRREGDGRLAQLESHLTGGRGDGTPHLTSQGSVVLSGDGAHLLVTNAGSDQLSVFAVDGDRLSLVEIVSTGGAAPKSVAEHDGLMYVLNAGSPSLAGFRLASGGAEALGGRELAPGADPAQVGFTPDGSQVVVTERGTDSIARFPVNADGRLGDPTIAASSGATPYGFAFAGGTLVVTEAFGAEKGKAAASSYRFGGADVEPVSRSVGNGRSEICWAVVSNDGRYVFTTNFADGAVSRYAVGGDGTLTLEDAVAAVAVEGKAGLRDEGLTGDGRFLYAVDADARRIFGWAVDGGRLSPVGSWEGVPETVAGLAAS
jgi:6-phosphogluconolactonase (cycloisomerase 2 family)